MEPKLDLPQRRVETPRLGNRATYKLAELTKVFKGEQVVLEVTPQTLDAFEDAARPQITLNGSSDASTVSKSHPVEVASTDKHVDPQNKGSLDLSSPEAIDASIIYHLRNECLAALQAGTYAEQVQGHSIESNVARERIITLMGKNMLNWVRRVIEERPQLLAVQCPNAVLRHELDWAALKRRVTDVLGNTKWMLANGPIPDDWLSRARRMYPTLKLPEELDPDIRIERYGTGHSDITPLVGAPDDEIIPQYSKAVKKQETEIDVGSLQGETIINQDQYRKLLEKIAEQKKKFGRQD